ncbi:hypothetical protein D3C81_1998190 [compost metagenome]
MNQAKTHGVAEGPFKIVHQRPGIIAFDRDARGNAALQLNQMLMNKIDPFLIRNHAIHRFIVVTGPVLGNVNGNISI